MRVQPTRDELVALTSLSTGERFPDGRPRVSDDLLERMKLVTTEEAWGCCAITAITASSKATDGDPPWYDHGWARRHGAVRAAPAGFSRWRFSRLGWQKDVPISAGRTRGSSRACRWAM